MTTHADDVAKKAVFVNDTQRAEAVGYINDGIEMFKEMVEPNKER